jgi:hypothetical protein
MSDAMINKIQALLNSAESHRESGQEEAANNFMAKADELMAKYQIDAAILAAANKDKAKPVEMPERVRFQFAGMDSPIATSLYNLCIRVAQHYDCAFHGYSNGFGDFIGLPSDIKFAEMVYTSLRLQLLRKIDPKVDMQRSYDENVYILHEAGINWERTCSQMNIARMHWMEEHNLDPKDSIGEPWPWVEWHEKKKDGGRLIRACKRWCKLMGLEYRAVQTPVTFQRSYAEGFRTEVSIRLYKLQEHRDAQVKATTGAELALRDKGALVQDAYDKYKEDNNIKEGRSYQQRIIGESYSRGRNDGRNADLGQTRVGDTRKEIR